MRLTALMLSALPALGALPAPEAHFGHAMGEDRALVQWSDVVGYFRALEAASDSVRVEELGKTTEGRPLIAAAIADPETILNLDAYRDALARLADPRVTPPDVAAELALTAKPAVAITCSIHSSEVASTLSAIQFAYDLLAEDTPRHRAILSGTILLLVPSLNPDGVDKVKGWYDRWLGTPYEGAPLTELYHRYVGHDNNRDWYAFTQQETRVVVEKLHNAWHPQIVYDVHQMGPNGARIFVPPWIDPIDANIDPLIAQQVNAFGTAMAVDLTAAGKKGVLVHGIYDYYSPARHYQSYHGALRLLSESASARFASPVTVPPEKLDRNGRGYDARARSWNFLEPWRGGDWRLADIVDNQLITFESVLHSSALRRHDLLRNFYEIGRRVIERGRGRAWVVPAAQHDPSAAERLLRTLRFGGVEIERVAEAAADASAVGVGDYLVRLAQPYGAFANTLLERQDYPDLRVYPGGPPRRPYDATAHSLPLLMGVDAFLAEGDLAAGTETVDEVRWSGGRVDEGGELMLSPAAGSAWIAVHRLLGAGVAVHRRASDGAFLVRADESSRPALQAAATDLGLEFAASADTASGHPPLRMPRVAVYAGHVPLMDEGWTRWLLDRYEVPYRSVGNEDVATGLAGEADVLVLPDARPAILDTGFANADREDSLVPPEYRGGLGDRGAAAILGFARSGGTVLAFNRAAAYAADRLRLPVENAVEGVPSRRFFGPGTLVNVDVAAGHPLGFGLRPREAAWFESGPVFRVRRSAGSKARPVLRYPARGVLAAGWLLGEGYLANRAAVVDVAVGLGRVILFGIRPQYRGQSEATFKMVLNGLHL